MKTILPCLFAVCFAGGPLAAQDKAPFPVAVVNLDRIYKTHQPHLDRLAPIKEAVAELEKNVQLRNAELETAVSKFRAAQPGTPEAARLQQQGAKLQLDLQQYVQKERDAVQKREAAVVLALYRDLEEEIRKYAKAKGIKLVIRQQDSSLDENQTVQQIFNALNRQIVYEDGLDITDDILKALDARAAAPKP